VTWSLAPPPLSCVAVRLLTGLRERDAKSHDTLDWGGFVYF